MLRAYESSKPRWEKKRAAGRARQATGSDRGRALLCARCGHPITDEGQRCERAGLHEHSQVNPHGYIWCFGCYREAPGARPDGPPSTQFSWFAGYSWRVGHCRGCGLHLGWLFEGDGDRFWGLIADRLIPGDEPT